MAPTGGLQTSAIYSKLSIVRLLVISFAVCEARFMDPSSNRPVNPKSASSSTSAADVAALEKVFRERTQELEQANAKLRAVIADNVRVNQGLRESEERFRQLAENINEVFWLAEPNRKIILYVSPAYKSAWGRSVESVIANPESWIDAIHPDDRERFRKLTTSESGVVEYDTEYRVVRPDGTVRWIHDRAFPILDEAGRPYRIAGVAEDITARKEAEIERKRLFDLSPDMFCIAGLDGYFKQLNPSWEQNLGYSFDELMAKPFIDFVHPDDRERTAAEAASVADGQSSATFENRYRCKDGSYKWLSWSSQVVPEDGLIFAVARDITARKKVADALKESEARFQAFMHENPALAWMKDEAGRYVYVNKTFTDVYRIPMENVLTRTDRDIMPASIVEMLQRNDARVLASRQAIESTETIPAPNGDLRSWQVWRFPFEDASGQRYVGGLAFDITDRLQAEAQVRQIQKLDSVGQLAAGIAHDFNNLLGIQHTCLSLLHLDDAISGKNAKLLEQIEAASHKAADLTRQLLLFSRKEVMQTCPVDLNRILRNLETMLTRTLGENLEVRITYSPDLPLIQVDPGMMDQVVMNLAINARDAMPNGGTLWISVSRVEFSNGSSRDNPEGRKGVFVCLRVTDSGTGIPESDRERIFDPFFTTKEIGKGTGLGLSTVHGIVKQHKGWIEVSSPPGQGATFEIFFPAMESADSDAISKPSPMHSDSSLISEVQPGEPHSTILIVEDEGALLDVTRIALTRFGYTVLSATSSEEGLRLWHLHKDEIDLLFTDLVMPGTVSGWQLAARLRQDKPTLKVVYTSGYSPEVAGKDLELQQGTTFLQKPFTLRSLIDAVQQCLRDGE